MSYLALLNTMAQRQNMDDKLTCYRNDAVRALAQNDFSMLSGISGEINSASNSSTEHYLDKLNRQLNKNSVFPFALSDQACLPEQFDASYKRALASCDSFILQKQLTHLNILAIRVDIAAKLAGHNSNNLSAALLQSDDTDTLQLEWRKFVQHGQQLAKNLSVDMSRHVGVNEWQSCLKQLSPITLTLLQTMTKDRLNLDAPEVNQTSRSPGTVHGN